MTGRVSGPKMLTAPVKSQLTIGNHPSPVKIGSVWYKKNYIIIIFYYIISYYIIQGVPKNVYTF